MHQPSGEILGGDRLALGAPGRALWRGCLGLSLAGWVATAALATRSSAGFHHAFLVSFAFFASLGLGALFFVLIAHLTRAGWSVVVRRQAEAVALTLPVLAPLALVVFLGRFELYAWADPARAAADELLRHKRAYLNAPFFLARLAFYFAAWSFLAIYFARRSRAQDATGRAEATLEMERMAAPGAIVYAMTVTFAAFDLLMSLDPHWSSTIYGVYYFAGAVLGACALIVVLSAWLQARGFVARAVGPEQYHDLGKLLFAFVVFWAYIAFSQYMLIWIAAIPEEATWYHARSHGPWLTVSLLLLVGHFFAPFLFLLSRHVKRRRPALVAAALWILLMHALDLAWLALPPARPHAPFALLDLTCFVAVGGLCLAVVFWRLTATGLVPLGDPRLPEALGVQHG